MPYFQFEIQIGKCNMQQREEENHIPPVAISVLWRKGRHSTGNLPFFLVWNRKSRFSRLSALRCPGTSAYAPFRGKVKRTAISVSATPRHQVTKGTPAEAGSGSKDPLRPSVKPHPQPCPPGAGWRVSVGVGKVRPAHARYALRGSHSRLESGGHFWLGRLLLSGFFLILSPGCWRSGGDWRKEGWGPLVPPGVA